MPKRIAIVDQRPDVLEFLKERIEAKGYEVITAFTEDEADALEPAPDLIIVDFEKQVDLAEVFKIIETELSAAET